MFEISDLSAWPRISLEPLGTREKFWLKNGAQERHLCKIIRGGTGEDYCEVVAACLADRLCLPHAQYTLATYDKKRAVSSKNFVLEGQTLVLGNELLGQIDESYDVGVIRFRQSTHTIARVLECFTKLELNVPLGWNSPSPEISSAKSVFLGYLALDALIGNTDRHHLNWGAILAQDSQSASKIHLAPTFDHGSSLGCHESEESKVKRLNTKDKNYTVEAFASKAPSSLFLSEADKKALGTVEAFLWATRADSYAASYWVDAISAIRSDDLAIMLDELPQDRISPDSKKFALRMMVANRDSLIAGFKAL